PLVDQDERHEREPLLLRYALHVSRAEPQIKPRDVGAIRPADAGRQGGISDLVVGVQEPEPLHDAQRPPADRALGPPGGFAVVEQGDCLGNAHVSHGLLPPGHPRRQSGPYGFMVRTKSLGITGKTRLTSSSAEVADKSSLEALFHRERTEARSYP